MLLDLFVNTHFLMRIFLLFVKTPEIDVIKFILKFTYHLSSVNQQWLLDHTNVGLLNLLSHWLVDFRIHQSLEIFTSYCVSLNLVNSFVKELTPSLFQAIVIIDRDNCFFRFCHNYLNSEKLLIKKLVANSDCSCLKKKYFINFIVLILN